MKKEHVRLLVRYGAACAVAGAMTWLVTRTYGLSEAQNTAEKYRILCDAFTIPGVVFVMVGLLAGIMGRGLLDGLAYAMRSLYRVFLPMSARKDETYYDYVQRRREARKGGRTAFLLHVGILFLIPALVFFALFYRSR